MCLPFFARVVFFCVFLLKKYIYIYLIKGRLVNKRHADTLRNRLELGRHHHCVFLRLDDARASKHKERISVAQSLVQLWLYHTKKIKKYRNNVNKNFSKKNKNNNKNNKAKPTSSASGVSVAARFLLSALVDDIIEIQLRVRAIFLKLSNPLTQKSSNKNNKRSFVCALCVLCAVCVRSTTKLGLSCLLF